ncbi:MAG: hypothetical protein Q9227_003774 [Pyrenula ochraceoflavens]
MPVGDSFQLASAVIQMVEFSTRVVTKGHQLYRDGTTLENLHIGNTTAELQQLSTRLADSIHASEEELMHDEDGSDFRKVCEKCCELSAVLQGKLGQLKLDSATKNRRWKSLRQGLKTVWSKDEIDAMASQLDRYRNQLNLTTVVKLKNELQVSQIENDEQFQNLKTADMKILMAVLENRDVFNARNDEVLRAIEHENEKSRQVFVDHITALLDLDRSLPGGEQQVKHRDLRALEVLLAAQFGNLEKLEELTLIKGTRFDVHDQFGRTALHFAADRGHLEMAKFLLGRRANVNYYDDDRQRTPLHIAVIRGNVGMVRLLLSRGAIDDLPDSSGATPAAYAVHPLITWLLKHGPDMERLNPDTGNTPLMDAVIHNNTTMVDQLLAEGAKTETRNWQQNTVLHEACIGYADWTPLFICARFNKIAVLDVLLNYNSIDLDVSCPHNVGSPNRHTAFCEAANCSRWDAAIRIAATGPNPNTFSDNGYRPLSAAAIRGPYQAVQAILHIPGIQIDVGNLNNWSPLKESVHHQRWDIFRLLLESGADPCQRDDEYPLLHRVVMAHVLPMSERLSLVQILLDLGVDVDAKNREGWTALNEAIHACHEPIIRLLLENRADISWQLDARLAPWMGVPTTHFTYLMQAVWERYLPTIDALIDHGADLEAVNGLGWTALRLAVERGSTENDQQDQACALLFRGANPLAKGRDGRTVMDVAKAKGLDLFLKRQDALFLLGHISIIEHEKESEPTTKHSPSHPYYASTISSSSQIQSYPEIFHSATGPAATQSIDISLTNGIENGITSRPIRALFNLTMQELHIPAPLRPIIPTRLIGKHEPTVQSLKPFTCLKLR